MLKQIASEKIQEPIMFNNVQSISVTPVLVAREVVHYRQQFDSDSEFSSVMFTCVFLVFPYIIFILHVKLLLLISNNAT